MEEDEMKCLTIKPKWCDLITSGKKFIENRSWGKNVRGQICIHRGAEKGKQGVIIATAYVADVITKEEALKQFPEQAEYITGPLCWVLDNVTPVEPIPCKGKLSLWEFDEKLLKRKGGAE
jgi:hypothetical protein